MDHLKNTAIVDEYLDYLNKKLSLRNGHGDGLFTTNKEHQWGHGTPLGSGVTSTYVLRTHTSDIHAMRGGWFVDPDSVILR